jgi:ribonuclease J
LALSTEDPVGVPASGEVRLVPLGGLGEFGLNSLVLDWQGELLLLDAGVLFPSVDQPGVDSIVPDFAYLSERPGKLHGIVLTHGHEDHIGALAHALAVARAPVFGSRLTLGFVRRRLQDRGVEADLRLLTPRQQASAGPFRIHPIAVSHSVRDSLAVAVETPAGVVLHTGDFKFDRSAQAEEQSDLESLRAWGDRGVLALLSDSTNVEHGGHSGSEDDVVPTFEEILERAPGRVLVTCFATAMPRIERVAGLSASHGRVVGFLGRRMTDNVSVAQELGVLHIPAGVVTSRSLGEIPREQLTAFVSGCQGEPFSALSLLALGEHRELKVEPGDVAVFSSRAIPGNERVVSRVISNFYRRGCDVVHAGVALCHVSGHANRDELAQMVQLVRPRYFVPVHGEYRMLAQHARLAVEAGVSPDHVFVLEDGDVLSVSASRARREAPVPAGRVLLDRGTEELEEVVIRHRRHLSSDGIVVPVVVLDKQTGIPEAAPEIVTRGFVDVETTDLMEEAGRLVLDTLAARPPEERGDPGMARERIRTELRRFFKRRTQRKPMVIPVVMEV